LGEKKIGFYKRKNISDIDLLSISFQSILKPYKFVGTKLRRKNKSLEGEEFICGFFTGSAN